MKTFREIENDKVFKALMDAANSPIQERKEDMTDRKGNWIQTYNGNKFWPIDPRPEEIDISDIAHSLSLQCRFNSQCDFFFSVAAHSVNVAEFIASTYHNKDQFYNEFLLDESDSKIGYDDMVAWGLLHDASEAYLPDVPGPIKGFFPDYKAVEKKIMEAVAEKFELPELDEFHLAYLKSIDHLMMLVEHKELGLSVKSPAPWPCPDFLKNKWPTIKLIMNDDWRQDELEFLFFFETLGIKQMENSNGQA